MQTSTTIRYLASATFVGGILIALLIGATWNITAAEVSITGRVTEEAVRHPLRWILAGILALFTTVSGFILYGIYGIVAELEETNGKAKPEEVEGV
jgi:UPF0716 family protein affecting phage T7 exclusion